MTLKGINVIFFIALPYRDSENLNVRLHVAVPYIHGKDLRTEKGVEHVKDFDHLADLVNLVFGQMIEASILPLGEKELEIVAEPYAADGTLRLSDVDSMGFALGTGFYYGDRPVFADYLKWDPQSCSWQRER